MFIEHRDASGAPPHARVQMRAVAICIGINVAAGACARLLLRDTTWPGWATLAIDAALGLLLALGETWARALFMIRILLGLTAWPGWLQGKDLLSLVVSATTGASYALALWGGQRRRLRYAAYGLTALAAVLVICDAL